MEAGAEEADAQVFGDQLDLAQVVVHFDAGFVQRRQRRARQFDLAPRLQRDRLARPGQRDDVAVLENLPPAEALRQTFEYRPHPGLALVRQRRQRLQIVAELFVFGADAPVRRELLSGFEEGDEVRRALYGRGRVDKHVHTGPSDSGRGGSRPLSE